MEDYGLIKRSFALLASKKRKEKMNALKSSFTELYITSYSTKKSNLSFF